MPHIYQHFVGIDIAAKTLTISIMPRGGSPQPARTFDQTSEGWTSLQQHLLQSGCQPTTTLVVLEATGSYWVALACVLHAAGFSVRLVNPEKLHKYAQSQSRRSKTDALDAQLLAQFASERELPLWTPPPQVYHDLRQRLVARDGLVAMRQQARNQFHALMQWPVVVTEVQTQLEGVIRQLDQEIRTLDQALATVLKDGAWAASAARMLSISGIGVVTTSWILVSTMNWTTCESGAAAANYAGLTPLRKESGTSVRQKAQLRGGGMRDCGTRCTWRR